MLRQLHNRRSGTSGHIGLAIWSAAAVLMSIFTLTGCDSKKADVRYATRPVFSCSDGDVFCNVADEAGLNDVMRYGKGVAIVDVNNDGWQDLFISDADPRTGKVYGVSAFYINNQDGTFTRDDLGVSEDDLNANWVGTFADYDNDGDQDLLLGNGGYAGESNLAFYENQIAENGKFVSKTDKAGFGALNNQMRGWWGVSWADYDLDGFADVALNPRIGKHFLFHNNGDGSFTEVGTQAGLVPPGNLWRRDGKNVVWIDYDADGDSDLYFAGLGSHAFYVNNGDGTFTESTAKVFHTPFPPNLVYPADTPVVFAAAAVDFNQDGFDDLYLGRQTEQDMILINDGNGKFEFLGASIGFDASQTHPDDHDSPFENTMGAGVGDVYDDGWIDVLIGTGTPFRADEDLLYCNQQGKTFERCTELLKANSVGTHWSRTHGVAFGDLNNDGQTDIFVNQGGHAPWDVENNIDTRELASLYIKQPTDKVHTAKITLQGTESNRDGFGARVRVAGNETHYYAIRSTQAFQSQNSRALLVTLGDADTAAVTVNWPSGKVSELTIEPGGSYHVIEGDEAQLPAS